MRMQTGFIWLSKEFSGGLCEHSNEPSGFIKGGEFLDQLSVLASPWNELVSYFG
jgi:hypothetical protein